MELVDDEIIHGTNGNHLCYVTHVARQKLARPEGVTYSLLGPSRLLASQLFKGVEYLHSHGIIHGGKFWNPLILQLPTLIYCE
jgi:hypothetical protein